MNTKLNMQDKNMLGGMCQHALMDYQDELQWLARIVVKSKGELERYFHIVNTILDCENMEQAWNKLPDVDIPEMKKAFFITEITLEVMGMLCKSRL